MQSTRLLCVVGFFCIAVGLVLPSLGLTLRSVVGLGVGARPLWIGVVGGGVAVLWVCLGLSGVGPVRGLWSVVLLVPLVLVLWLGVLEAAFVLPDGPLCEGLMVSLGLLIVGLAVSSVEGVLAIVVLLLVGPLRGCSPWEGLCSLLALFECTGGVDLLLAGLEFLWAVVALLLGFLQQLTPWEEKVHRQKFPSSDQVSP